jgi:hypothetical protein
MASQDKDNFEFLLAMDEEVLYRWLASVPERYLDYIEELLTVTEDRVDKFVMDNCSLKEANSVINKIKLL